MELLQAGVDTTVISLWLGHESVETTHVYLEADLAMKEKMLAKTTAHDGTPGVLQAARRAARLPQGALRLTRTMPRSQA